MTPGPVERIINMNMFIKERRGRILYGTHLGARRAVRISTAIFAFHAPLLALLVYASMPHPGAWLLSLALTPAAGAIFGRLLHWIFCGTDFEELAYPLNVGSLLGIVFGAIPGAIPRGSWTWLS